MIYSQIRPSSIDYLYGKHLDPVREDIESGSIREAYLLHGDSGTGKTTTAYVLASQLEHCNIVEINAASDSTKKDAEKIIAKNLTVPLGYKNQVIILNEIHKASAGFFSALLDATEFPPKGIYFIATTTDISKIPADAFSRYKKIKFSPLSKGDIETVLDDGRMVCGVTDPLPSSVVDLIYKRCGGSARNALTDLELISNISEEKEMLDRLFIVREEESTKISDLFFAIYKSRPWGEIVKLLNGLNQGVPEGIRITFLNMATNLVLKPGISEDDMYMCYDIIRMCNSKEVWKDFKDLVEFCLEVRLSD